MERHGHGRQTPRAHCLLSISLELIMESCGIVAWNDRFPRSVDDGSRGYICSLLTFTCYSWVYIATSTRTRRSNIQQHSQTSSLKCNFLYNHEDAAASLIRPAHCADFFSYSEILWLGWISSKGLLHRPCLLLWKDPSDCRYVLELVKDFFPHKCYIWFWHTCLTNIQETTGIR